MDSEDRANKFLEDHLDAEQLKTWRRHQMFTVIGGSTRRRYRIDYGSTFNVHWLNDEDEYKISYCAHPHGALPIPDVVLAQLLMLRFAERAFLAIAHQDVFTDPSA